MDGCGRAIARPQRSQREHLVEEQISWAVAAEKRSAQYFESFAFRSGKALDNAGRFIPHERYFSSYYPIWLQKRTLI